jgi:hypothetical protein
MARKPATRNKKSSVRSIDFAGVESGGGGGFHIPEGDYRMKCTSAEWDESKEGNDMIAWTWQGLEGKAKGKKFYFYTAVTENSLWKLKETLEAIGIEVPDGELDIDTSELVDLEGVATVEDDDYQGKTRSKIARFINGEDESEEEEEEEDTKPAKGTKAKPGASKKKVVKTSADEVNEMDEDELEALIEKNGLEVDLSDHKILRKKRAAVVAALEENDLLEE